MSKKDKKEQGIALITVLSIMVILLILSLGVVTMSANNLIVTSNTSARTQALNIANAGVADAMYNLASLPVPTPWNPGDTPPTGAAPYTISDVTIDTQSVSGGTCKVAVANNLNNTNSNTILNPYFSSSFSTTLPPETAIIVSRGDFGGFKRTVKALVTTNPGVYFSMAASNTINFGSDTLIVNGIEDINTLYPCAGPVYSLGTGSDSITYGGVPGDYKFFNGSRIISSGSINVPNMNTIDKSRFVKEHAAPISIVDWDLNNTSLTGKPLAFNRLPSCIRPIVEEPNMVVTVPSFTVTPDTDPNEVYRVLDLYVNNSTGDIFVNGSLHIKRSLIIGDNKKLFVNGILIVDENICNLTTGGSIFVSGYRTDSSNYGLSMEVNIDTQPFVSSDLQGITIYADGDVRIKGKNKNVTSLPENTDKWLKDMPEDAIKIKEAFHMVGVDKLKLDYTTSTLLLWWYANALSTNMQLTGFTGLQIFQGLANDKLVEAGYPPIPEEINKWFNSENNAMLRWSLIYYSGPYDNISKWDTFKMNPSLYAKNNDVFLQGAAYTHGKFTTEGTAAPVRIVGVVVAKDKPGVSPAGHGGVIELSGNSSVILNKECFSSGKAILKRIVKVISIEEI